MREFPGARREPTRSRGFCARLSRANLFRGTDALRACARPMRRSGRNPSLESDPLPELDDAHIEAIPSGCVNLLLRRGCPAEELEPRSQLGGVGRRPPACGPPRGINKQLLCFVRPPQRNARRAFGSYTPGPTHRRKLLLELFGSTPGAGEGRGQGSGGYSHNYPNPALLGEDKGTG